MLTITLNIFLDCHCNPITKKFDHKKENVTIDKIWLPSLDHEHTQVIIFILYVYNIMHSIKYNEI